MRTLIFYLGEIKMDSRYSINEINEALKLAEEQRFLNKQATSETDKVKEFVQLDELKVGAAITNPGCIHVHFVEIHHHHNYGPIFDGCDIHQCDISGSGVE